MPVTELVSIDCAENVTLERKVIIPENTDIEFKYSTHTTVNKVMSQVTSRGEGLVLRLVYHSMLVDGIGIIF